MSNPIKLRIEDRYNTGTFLMYLTCEDHSDFEWTFDFERKEPGEWECALMIAYGHWFYAHGAPPLRLVTPEWGGSIDTTNLQHYILWNGAV